MNEARLFHIRTALLKAFMEVHHLDGLLLNRHDNFSMATGGRRSLIYTYGDIGGNGLFLNKDGEVFYAGNTIELDRCMDEELTGLNCGEMVGGWWDRTPAKLVAEKHKGKIASDDGTIGENIHQKLAPLRALLSPLEMDKYRVLGKLAAESMTATLKSIKKGMSEAEIAAILKYEGGKRQCQVPVALVAADERARKYRHPIPSESLLLGGGEAPNSVQSFVMVVGCFLKEGLVCSITRFAQVDTLPDGVEDAYKRICMVDATLQMATRPGRNLGEIFTDLQKAYLTYGFPENEWHHHHQGGVAGYTGRACKATPSETFPTIPLEWGRRAEEIIGVKLEWGAAFAWNPSAPSVKSEDTFIMSESGVQEVVSGTPTLPAMDLGELGAKHPEIYRSGFYLAM